MCYFLQVEKAWQQVGKQGKPHSEVDPVALSAELFNVGSMLWVEVFWVELNVDSVLNYGLQT